MKAKLFSLIIALAMLGLGGHMIAEPLKYDMTNADTSGRRAVHKKAFAMVVNTIGARPTGAVLVACGAGLVLLTLRSGARQPKQSPA